MHYLYDYREMFLTSMSAPSRHPLKRFVQVYRFRGKSWNIEDTVALANNKTWRCGVLTTAFDQLRAFCGKQQKPNPTEKKNLGRREGQAKETGHARLETSLDIFGVVGKNKQKKWSTKHQWYYHRHGVSL